MITRHHIYLLPASSMVQEAALFVVLRLLDAVGVNAACLEVHLIAAPPRSLHCPDQQDVKVQARCWICATCIKLSAHTSP
jgi:hypothetical protein